jgi:hypothetical protein
VGVVVVIVKTGSVTVFDPGIVVAVPVIALTVREVLHVPDEVVEGVTYVADVADVIDAKCADGGRRGC